MTVLFVNACLRGDESRTLTLCREYLEGIEDVKEVNLSELRLEPYYGDSAAYRAQLEAKGLFDDPMFDIGKDFAEADEIVIGAPYWDLSFPAALKIYIEHAAVMGMTFHYTEEGICEGCGVATLSISYYDLGVATGKMALKVLVDGEDISKMPIEYAPQFTKEYNPEICKELGIEVPDDYVAIGADAEEETSEDDADAADDTAEETTEEAE